MVTAELSQLRDRLRQYGQDHVLVGWERLSELERRELISHLAALDLDELRHLYERRETCYALPACDRIQPAPIVPRGADVAAARARGEEALRRGEVGVLLVAGGQGSRLGFERSKGLYPVGPVSGKSLFQIHAEKVLALQRRYGAAVPFLVMTSPATDAETRAYFADNGYFGLPADDVWFFVQGTMPALDLETGRLLLERPGRLFLSPDGHGGTLTALADTGLLDRVHRRGVQHLFYFQVDNPLVQIADPVFLGHHLAGRAEVSSKVVPKLGPADKLGVIVQVEGRCTIIEYSDLPPQLAHERGADGRLRLWAGSPAIHVFDVEFLGRVTRQADLLPFHVARKKVPHVDPEGRPVQPRAENALKFERFIFDVLPLAERWAVVETSRAEEFAPLKSAEGADSPAAVRQALSDLAAAWLQAAGVDVPRRPDGSAAVALEVSPLFALDAEEFATRIDRHTVMEAPQYFGERRS
jgi:UDP-N-acetylglucosamine/UDP-N-acetylgalactosamine diphosphorylase